MPRLLFRISLPFLYLGLAAAVTMTTTIVSMIHRAQNIIMRRSASLGSALHHRRHHQQRGGANTAFIYHPSVKSAGIRFGTVPTTTASIRKEIFSGTKMRTQFHGICHRTARTRPPLSMPAAPLRASLSTLELDQNDVHDCNTTSLPIGSITDDLNPSQEEATLRPRYSITRVIAGPGAGKTKVLTCRIAHLLLDRSHREDREGILAVTFTKKAAMEMERRLTDLVSSSVVPRGVDHSSSSSDAATAIISTGEEYLEEGEFVDYGNADPGDESNLENDANSIARQFMRQTTVGTFHSVCSKILRKFGKELGNLPSVRNCLGVANASGATVTQEGLQAASLENGGEYANQVLVQTLEGSFNILDQSDQLRLLKEVLKKLNIELKSPGAASGGRNNDIRPITVLNAISLLNTKDATKMTSSGGNDDDDGGGKMSKKVRRIAEAVQIPFQKAKYSQNSIDFDDLILLTRELLLVHPEVREVLHRRWCHILVDEFQDTSQVQLDLVRLLTTNSLFVVGDGDQSIYSWRGASPESMSDFEMVFHDRRHGWEGLLKNHEGTLSQYLERIGRLNVSKDDFQADVLTVASVYLMENYRSTTNIVKAAQRVISVSKKSDKQDSKSAQDNIRRDMKPMRGTGPSPRVLACKDARAEANFAVKTINSMVDSGELTPSSTVAMIYRTNAQSRLLEEACVEHNLRYVVRGSSGTFYKRAEIQDCMSFLKIMYNSRDQSAWARAVKAPSRGIGEASLNEFFRYCDAVTKKHLEMAQDGNVTPTPMDVMISLAPNSGTSNDIGMLIPPKDIMSTRSLNRFIPFASSLHSLRRKAEGQPVHDFLLSVIEDLGLKNHFDSISKTRDEYEDRLSNVMELVRAAERYKDDGPCISPISEEDPLEIPLGNFLDDVALIADIAPDESDSESGGRVVANLMTIHSSKGMEFDSVILVGNEEGTFPTQRSIAEGEGSIELSEERRLCYVAMTRAKTHLVLTWRREVSFFAGSAFKTRDADRSRFLDILVSKQGATPSKGVPKKQASNKISAGNMDSNSIGQSVSMTKRQLHSEANRYLATGTKSWDDWEPTSRKKPVADVPHSEADRYLATGNKSWDDWEPTSLKKPVANVPVIKPNTSFRVADRRQISSSSQDVIPRMKSKNDRQQLISTSQNQRRSEEINPKKGQMGYPPSRERPIDRRQIKPSPRTIHQSRPISKKPSQTARHTSTSQNEAALTGEPPPHMDSTLFYPVGSPVKHKLHGEGIVQTPPESDQEFADKLLVRVKFNEEDVDWDLPMNGLMHTYN